jgi:predicted nucleic acid-binding protein
MPTATSRERPRRPDALVDSSVAIPLVVVDHEHHGLVARAVRGRRLGLAGHAAFETFSVLTRLPPPARRRPEVTERLLRASFPATRFLGADDAASLFRRLAELGVSGGSVFDALVGAVAVAHGVPLATRDTRALDVYRALDVDLELIA